MKIERQYRQKGKQGDVRSTIFSVRVPQFAAGWVRCAAPRNFKRLGIHGQLGRSLSDDGFSRAERVIAEEFMKFLIERHTV